MKFLVYSAMNAETVVHNFGEPEYSYYFVLREFMPLLHSLGEVVVIADPEREVDAIYQEAVEQGENCVFLSFSPPHLTRRDLACPTIPVFAWEFSSMPGETWWEDCPENDWRLSLQHCGAAIVHSQQSARVVRELMGEDFPVVSIPAPLWDRLDAMRAQLLTAPVKALAPVCIERGVVFDTHDPKLSRWLPSEEHMIRAVAESRGLIPIDEEQGYRRMSQGVRAITYRHLVAWCRQVLTPSLPLPLRPLVDVLIGDPWHAGKRSVKLGGVVFTSLFNPHDGRKNWVDMLTAFCTVFKDEPSATLVFKLGHHRYEDAIQGILMVLPRLETFRCRVVVMHGYLSDEAYTDLLRATHFVVNASYGEGQCLPLMEYLSCGKPAVAPRHSALTDYMDESVGFLVDSWADATAWPHDPRVAYRTLRQQVDWSSLCEAFGAAYRCYRDDPERYRQMARNAIERMHEHCSLATARPRLTTLLEQMMTKEPA